MTTYPLRQPYRCRHRNKTGFASACTLGFTLIELLIVIGIIALLTGVLFPVFSQALAKARETRCLNNMKQLGAAFALYLQDYDSTYPDAQVGSLRWTIPRSSWNPNTPFYLRPYLKNTDVLICPQERAISSVTRYPQYAINKLPNLSTIAAPDGGSTVGPFSEIPKHIRTDSKVDSANTMMLWEHDSIGTACGVWDTTPRHWDTGHQGGFLSLWCDGHAKRMTLGKMQNAYVTYWND